MGRYHEATVSPRRTTALLCPPRRKVSRGAVNFRRNLVPRAGGRQDLRRWLGPGGFIHRTEPRRRAPALLLRLIQPWTTCTLLVHLLPLYLSLGCFHTLGRCRYKLSLGPDVRSGVSPQRVPTGYESGILASDHDHVKGRVAVTLRFVARTPLLPTGFKANDVPEEAGNFRTSASPCATAVYIEIAGSRSQFLITLLSVCPT
jgi:hypothetical protein